MEEKIMKVHDTKHDSDENRKNADDFLVAKIDGAEQGVFLVMSDSKLFRYAVDHARYDEKTY
jgi:hypothetical protein